MAVDKALYDKIINENISVHTKEAGLYDIIHTTGRNWYAQHLLTRDIKRTVKKAPGKKACDLGCGTGNVTKRLLEAGCQVIAVDLSGPMLDEMNKKIGCEKGLNTFCGNIDSFLRQTGEQFDIITINAVLHHMPDYLETIALALARLAPGGIMYLVDGIHREKQNRYYSFVRKCLLWVDKKLYVLMRGNEEVVFNHGIDYTYSDYHCNAAGTNGLDVSGIKGLIDSSGAGIIGFSGYNIGMYLGFLAMLDDAFSMSKNCFRMIARKEKRI